MVSSYIHFQKGFPRRRIFPRSGMHRGLVSGNGIQNAFQHSHKKRKDNMEGSLDRVLLVAELEFPKILVPRLSLNTSDVNIECVGKS